MMKLRTTLPFLFLFVHALFAQGIRNAPRVYGPATVQYATANAQLTLPAGTFFVQGDSAKIYLAHNGYPEADVDAVIVSYSEDSKWNLRLKYYNDGHMTTKDAKSELGDIFFEDAVKKQWDKENGLRLLGGFPDQPFTRIIEKPLVTTEPPVFEYSFEAIQDTVFMIERRVILFARNGVLLASLTCQHAQYGDVKPVVNGILSPDVFQSGFLYTDFSEDTDKLAENGVGMVLFGLQRERGGWIWKAILVLVLVLVSSGYFYYERVYLKKKKPLPTKRPGARRVRAQRTPPPLTPPPGTRR